MGPRLTLVHSAPAYVSARRSASCTGELLKILCNQSRHADEAGLRRHGAKGCSVSALCGKAGTDGNGIAIWPGAGSGFQRTLCWEGVWSRVCTTTMEIEADGGHCSSLRHPCVGLSCRVRAHMPYLHVTECMYELGAVLEWMGFEDIFSPTQCRK